MAKKTIVWITLACFVATIAGCTTTDEILTQQLRLNEEYSIIEAVTYKGEHYVFREVEGQGAAVKDSTLVGVLDSGKQVRIPLSEIHRVYAKKVSPGLTILAVVGTTILVVGIIGLIALLTKKSCPFVYSFDGQQYVFDGEPFGGAICDALERTDWCQLEHLKPVGGQYRLLLTNEVDETQYTDEFKLWVVDHRPGTVVFPDATGHLYSVQSPLQPIRATDAQGDDISKWVATNDRLFWESDLRSKDPARPADRRDTLLIEFPRASGAAQAKLVVNGSTTMWGSQMLKLMTELHGTQVPQWYEGLKDPVNLALLDAWGMREELYKLQVKVQIGGTWQTRGILWGGGPYVSETRVVPLDLRQVEGDTLRILLAPPAGFWQLNSFAIDYSETPTPEYMEIAASAMVGHDGTDLRNTLSATDKQYYVMPETGQKAAITFPAPPEKPGYVRTVFAKVSGYYDLRARTEGLPQASALERITGEPGYTVSFSLQEYAKWKSELAKNIPEKRE